jgi:hypothetical protein
MPGDKGARAVNGIDDPDKRRIEADGSVLLAEDAIVWEVVFDQLSQSRFAAAISRGDRVVAALIGLLVVDRHAVRKKGSVSRRAMACIVEKRRCAPRWRSAADQSWGISTIAIGDGLRMPWIALAGKRGCLPLCRTL